MSEINDVSEALKDESASYNGPVLQMEFRTPKDCLHKAILDTMHNTFKGNQDYIDSNIVVSQAITKNDNVAGVYICLNDIQDKEALTSKLSELGVNVAETFNKYNERPHKQCLCRMVDDKKED